MNTETKRHIDAARQVLVGVVPNPTSQIDQITNALIYKFMDDMDQSAIKAGGEPSFFVGDLEHYAWTRLMDTRIGNQERMNLYSEALVKFSESKQLPQLFRDIFKSAFLPYRSPEVLGMFLKEIAYFDYSHPEELGNAYEYLLSIMSSQGDAGQFRTPRHIIDFIVDAVNPTKDDKVLDPACGTGGFLVSAYKQILEQHDGKNDPDKKEKPLTPDQRKSLMNNFEGYDVDPGMVRIAQVNMYLHQFKNPKIVQYDSLSMEERWGDKFDVILANPPFMSPRGGVQPHNKFSVQSSRSEVLFVDYIMNHLRPKGRAGIIVPEGIIFQSGGAHKQLRKNLVEDGLYAVVSLPSGVFQPYSGVKTSILFFDNGLAKQRKQVLFVDIKDTGVSLGATQRLIKENDLKPAVLAIKKFNEGGIIEPNKFAFVIEKNEIVEMGYELSLSKYRKKISIGDELKFAMLSDVCNIIKGKSSSTKTDPGAFRLYLTAKEFKTADHFDFDGEGVCVPLISATGHGKAAIKRVHYVKGKFALANLMAFVEPKDKEIIDSKFLYHCLNSSKDEMAKLMKGAANVSMKVSDLERYQIPLPSIETQYQIVKELESYQNLIAGATKVIENWKPIIEIDKKWHKVKLGDVNNIYQPRTITSKEILSEGPHKVFGANGVIGFYDKFNHEDEEVLLTCRGATCGTINFSDPKSWVTGNAMVISPIDKNVLDKKYLLFYLSTLDFSSVISGAAQPQITATSLRPFEILLPPFEIQIKIVEKIETERVLIDANKKLVEIYEQKMKDAVAKLWNE